MLRDFTPRLYQQTLLGTAAQHNTLVVLPTGLGKTAVAFLLTAQRLLQYPQSKILMLAPTKPLCEQHLQTFRKHLEIPENKIVLFTGEISPEKRAVLWKDATIIISTPQGLENDTINKRVDLKDISLLIFDEAHHATGEYSYVWLADQYEKLSSFPRILALTASPGSDMESIQEVCKNLKIERVEVRTEKDADVKPYVQHMKKNWVMVEFPQEFRKVQQLLQNCKKSKLIEIQNFGYCKDAELGKGEMLGLQGEFQQKLSQGFREIELLRSVSLLAEAMKVEHALELLETQGIKQLSEYFKKIQEESLNSTVKAVKNLVTDLCFKGAAFLTEDLLQKNIQHPKLPKLREIVQEEVQRNPETKLIIFTQYRDSAEEVVRELSNLQVSNHIFVGQAKKKGLGFSQKQQKEILEKFRAGEFKVLVATSVAEEGLDIPKVDKVIFFEPVPSAIRSIQRRGRTGRLEEGEVTLLITQGTRDEGYRWSSHHKEKRMHRNLEQLRSNFTATKTEPTLQRFIPENQAVLILADHREKDNKIVKELIDLGISVRTGQLISADYVLSGRVGVELKKVPDFVDSLIDGRLLEQVRQLRNNFDKAVLLIEGEEDIYSIRKVHANALRGLLASIVLDFNVPVLYTKNPRDTAGLLAVMAKREQEKGGEISLHEKKPQTLKEQQEFLIAALPNVGIVTAKNLLMHFGSIKGVVNASSEELIKLEGVGEKTAEKLKEVFEGGYEKE
ncbi:DEAD/DEAH box helicase family protein [Candidatus Woesearchaeota archaeon]|nr:DEAD/DEAH box helicase family protein [Candidatus Woesearchaeota archaeon]